MKQLIRWNEKEKKISVISSFTQDEAERRIEDYVNGISCGHADLNRKDLTAEIVFPDGSSEFLQVTDVPGDDTIRVDTRLGKLEASVNNGPGHDVQVWSTTDGGETYFHCGLGKFCRTLEEALAYKAGMDVLEHCPKAPAVMKRAIRILSAMLGGICGEVTA